MLLIWLIGGLRGLLLLLFWNHGLRLLLSKGCESFETLRHFAEWGALRLLAWLTWRLRCLLFGAEQPLQTLLHTLLQLLLRLLLTQKQALQPLRRFLLVLLRALQHVLLAGVMLHQLRQAALCLHASLLSGTW